ncbi:MAG: alpha/beta fold hydrolase [Pseudomonadota bacterium]
MSARPSSSLCPLPVLLHGWGFSGAVWDPVRAALAGVEALAPDLPGHGAAGGAGRLRDPENLGRGLCAALPAAVTPIWVGWSLGGLAALLAARAWRGPQRLVLLGSSPRLAAAPDWPNALGADELSDFRAALGGPRARLERRLALLCAQGDPAAATLAGELVKALRANPASSAGLAAGLDLLEGADLRAVWRDIDCPVAAWPAQSDALVPAAVVADLVALRPDARVRYIPGGHASWWRDPAPLVAGLREELA